MSGSVVEIRDAVRSRERSAEQVVRGVLDAIAARDGELNAFTQVFEEEAIQRARAVDARVEAGEDPGPLAGVPIAVKDNICTAIGRTTCASRMLEGYRSPFSATAVERLESAGAVVVGKTNLDEFAMGSTGEHSCFGPTKNPWDTSRAPGGSSSGSACAVAAGLVPAALGSDTGGSIRQPAGWCGVVGVKPTYGRVSRWGLVAFASSLDQIGPVTTSVEDAAAVLDAIGGHDPKDATSSSRTIEPWKNPDADGGVRIGVPRQVAGGDHHPAVDAAMARVVADLESRGGSVVEVDLPSLDLGIAAYYVVATAEASSNLARYDGVRYGRRTELGAGEGLEELYQRSRSEGFGAEVQRRILLGTYALSAGYADRYYHRALQIRRVILDEYRRAFASCDAVLMPTSPHPAIRLGEKADDPAALYLEDLYTVGVNLAGLPAVALPGDYADVDATTLPVGVQLVGPAFGDAELLRIAHGMQRSLGVKRADA